MNRLSFSRPKGEDSLSTFRTKKVKVNNPNAVSDRSFYFNKESIDDIVPVIYLDDKIKKYNDDDTPDFTEMNNFCHKIFKEQILPELRPDIAQ